MNNHQSSSHNSNHERGNTDLDINNTLSLYKKKQRKFICGLIIVFLIALLLAIALVVSIALMFIIGVKVTKADKTDDLVLSSTAPTSTPSVTPFYKPCQCGCPLIEPVFNTDMNSTTARIVNGQTARAHSWPWQIYLLAQNPVTKQTSSCGATLISQNHVLTAAHCVHGYYSSNIFLYSGKHTRNFTGSSYDGVHYVDRVYIHERFSALGHNDIAILTTKEAFRFDSQVMPICLTSSHSLLQTDEELVTIGWGRTSGQPATAIFPAYLQQVTVTYMPSSNPKCSSVLDSKVALHPGQMCAGRDGYNVCRGDSGGPLMRRMRLADTNTYYWEQVGIASLSKDCGWNSTLPDIYTNIQYYYDWIIATAKRSI